MGPKTMAEKLRKLRGYCDMSKANFGWEKLPGTDADVDAFVKEKTRLYRETWILPIIDELIEATDPAAVEASAGR